MVLVISGKGDVDLLNIYDKNDFESYELYIGTYNEDIYEKILSVPSYIKIKFIHNPTKVMVNEKVHPFDLSDRGIIGKESFNALKKTINLSKKINCKNIIIHGAKYKKGEEKEEFLNLLAERINHLKTEGINFLFETDAKWFPLFSNKEALLSCKKDFIYLEKLLNTKLKIAADIEHLQISFYYEKFLDYFNSKSSREISFNSSNNLTETEFESEFELFITRNYKSLKEELKEYLEEFFNVFNDKIEHIHLNGSDVFNFKLNKGKLPLLGEHLPLNFNKDPIKDRIDYSHLSNLFKALPKNKKIHIILEVWDRNKDNLINEMLKSKSFLTNYLN